MQFKRAQEILNSPHNIGVNYNNNPVWIESINSSNYMAHVKVLGTDEIIDVAVKDLTEQQY
ncbi:MAG: H-type small acid-soluble spore protein [Bacillota bacterium]